MALIATSLYTLDRVIRFTRFFYYLPSTTATLTPLPSSNAVRVTLSRSMTRASPGSHAFLYIPSIRLLQTHPFTMVNRDPVEFVISARDGFTRSLFEKACQKPGMKVRAGIEGAYGRMPRTEGYERVLLFAGGSGATFAFALAVDWARKHGVESNQKLDFVWSVRTAAQLAGFKTELSVLETHPRIDMSVHVTKALKSASVSPSETPTLVETTSTTPSPIDEKFETDIRIEKLPIALEEEAAPLPTYAVPGRPDILAVVSRVADECQTVDRVLVAACGPAGLSDGVRDAVKECMKAGGPNLRLHLEAFGW